MFAAFLLDSDLAVARVRCLLGTQAQQLLLRSISHSGNCKGTKQARNGVVRNLCLFLDTYFYFLEVHASLAARPGRFMHSDTVSVLGQVSYGIRVHLLMS